MDTPSHLITRVSFTDVRLIVNLVRLPPKFVSILWGETLLFISYGMFRRSLWSGCEYLVLIAIVSN